MRDSFSFNEANQFASPEQGAAVSASSETGKAIFIAPAKFYAVSILLWVGIIAGSACAWVGAFKIGATIARMFS